jgi:LysR family transcriptional regulator, transcriptional activator of the cysJI operon
VGRVPFRNLERILKLTLVERTRRDGALTSAGDFVANHVLRAESLLAQAERGAAQFRNSGSGSLSIVASWLTGTYLLPAIIAEFQNARPGVRVLLEMGTAARAVEWLRSHRAELGFVADAAGGPEIEVEPLLENEIAIVGNRALVSRRSSRESLEELTWISREEGSATRDTADTALARLGIVPRRRLPLPSYEAVIHALKSGYGIAAMNRHVVAEELRKGSLTVIPVRGWNARSMVSVLRVRDARVTPLANEFQTLVRIRFKEIALQRTRKRRV